MSIVTIIYIILQSVLFFNATESLPTSKEHEIQQTSQNSVRAKRSLSETMPFQLRVKMKYQQEQEINLVWTRRHQTLANEYLPVIPPFDYSGNVMDDVGEFIMYYDTKQSSAVVYFKKSNAFYGVIGVDYYIDGLPFDFDDKGEHRLGTIPELYIRKIREPLVHIDPLLDIPAPFDEEAWNNYIEPSDFHLHQSRKHPANCVLDTTAKQSRTERHIRGIIEAVVNINEHKNGTSRKRRDATKKAEYFLETLIFVTRDIVELFKRTFGADHYVEWIVRHLIVYFSAVDMIFQRLTITKVQMFINIAKIVIEDDLTPFSFISQDDELQFKYINAKLPHYLYDHKDYYTLDSFDNVFVYTSRSIMDGVVQVDGLTKHGANLYEARKLKRFYTVVPITVVKFKYFFADYVTTVYEIGRIVHLKIESRNKGSTSIGQCYRIMQRGGPKCDKCLNWSADSQEQFEIFFSENRNRCFLLNEPRSLRPPGPSNFLTPHRQCECFGYNSHQAHSNGAPKYSVNKSGCQKPLQCTFADDQLHRIPTVPPFDGTKCGHNNEVCWNGECIARQTQQLMNQQCQI